MRWTSLWRMSASALLVLLAFATLRAFPVGAAVVRPDATPSAAASCDTATPTAGTPAMDHGDMAGMDMGTPMAGMEMDVEFDQLYIDMMLPHHGSIIAMAHAALPRLTDPRLREISQAIIDTQSAEQAELHGYREQFYGAAESAPMDTGYMDAMMAAMPGMGEMDDMVFQMDAVAQVAAICAAEDTDLAFIELTIPHHEMAITASEAALTQAVHPEIAAFALRVIDAQQAEIDELTAIRSELTGGTPASA